MARKPKGHEADRGRNSGSTQSHSSSGSSTTQSRSGDKTRGGAGDGMSGRPDESRNRPAESVGQQSNADTDGGAPSRQTSTASEEKGQL